MTIGAFSNSLNFVFGLANFKEDFDILNNPYVKFHGFKMSGASPVKLDEKYEVALCPLEIKNRFIAENVISWYPQALCFKD